MRWRFTLSYAVLKTASATLSRNLSTHPINRSFQTIVIIPDALEHLKYFIYGTYIYK